MTPLLRFPRPLRVLLVFLSALVATAAALTPAYAVEIHHWERKPIPVDLPVGEERIVLIDRNVRIGLPAELADPEVLRVQSVGGALYLKAKKTFDTQRVQVQDIESGQIFLIDLAATEGASAEDLRIVVSGDQSSTSAADKKKSANEEGASSPDASNAPPLPVRLTRYAAQTLYAPLRTVAPLPGVRRVPMRVSQTVPLFWELPLQAQPLAAWRAGGLTVTAVEITNPDPNREFGLDPRRLQGEFVTATFMHPSVGPSTSEYAQTTVFLVTRGGGLEKALYPAAPKTQDTAMKETTDAEK
ncbi:TIGR03749 family integrating conjugative element protein [Alloalcanivorax xenomutans]|uniref:TIGR03749 family integrating conjugative element protein n=1 Tax=Alloalcanivorax xenomutans TaxID=1094342 RepID=UPI0029349113|nr:TIGR03749 family integrating conjugative element protein [Alloalcanivorax xenomutans]WOD27660.1 TIGR03749 family integrating conjugative element protein [Alloalcanivorax xenomutans]